MKTFVMAKIPNLPLELPPEDLSMDFTPHERLKNLKEKAGLKETKNRLMMIAVPRNQWVEQQARQAQRNYLAYDHGNKTDTWIGYQNQHGPYHAIGKVDAEYAFGAQKKSPKYRLATLSIATQGSFKHEDYGYESKDVNEGCGDNGNMDSQK